jgi:phage gp46-like protein
MSGDDHTTSAEALAFWAERSESAGDRAWRKWRRDLEKLIAFLAERSAASAVDEARLVAMKAAANAQVAEAEAEAARLQVAVEVADAKFEKNLHQLCGGKLQ